MKSFLQMKKFRRVAYIVLAVLSGTVVRSTIQDTPASHSKINYSYTVNESDPGQSKVRIEISGISREEVTVRMPRWSPGSYRIRDYAQNVEAFRAFDVAGRELTFEQVGKDGWRVDVHGDSLVVEYEVEQAYQPWSGAGQDSSYVLVEGPSVFMYVDGQKHRPVSVSYEVPDGWDIASPLARDQASGVFYARDYDVLIDSPAQLGKFDRQSLQLGEAQVELIFHGPIRFSRHKFSNMVEKICRYQVDFFGEIPFDRYVFFYNLLPGYRSGGGLEHSNSTTIGLASELLTASVMSAAEVTAHEFFHVWNVKRIHPKVFEVLDYDTEERTRTLWFAEGVTSYYEALTLVRTGLWDERAFFDELARQIERLQKTDERKEVSVEEASWDIWERGYGHPGVSFYNKGEILGVLLDLEIRHRTSNRASLDDVLRTMNERFGKKQLGFTKDDVEAIVNEISESDFSEFFDNYVAGTRELPYQKFFAFAGMGVSLEESFLPHLGEVVFVGPNNRVVSVERSSPVEKAGLRRDDYLVALDSVRIGSLSEWLQEVSKMTTGQRVVVRISRKGQELELPAQVGEQRTVECDIHTVSHLSPVQTIIWRGWMEGWTGVATPDSADDKSSTGD